jgi:hypothetical protein
MHASRTKLVGVGAVGWLVAACVAGAAHAGGAEDKTAADALFDEGKRLLVAKQYADACPKLEASQRLDPGIGTLLYLGDCYEGAGRNASAWSTFREAASAAKAAGQAQREAIARAKASALEATLHRVTVVVATPDVPGLEVKRGDVVLARELFGTAIPVDPGSYVVTATAPGKRPFSSELAVPRAAGASTVRVPALEAAPVPASPPGPVAAAPAGPVAAASEPPPSGPHPRRVAGAALGLGGLVVLGVGGVLTGLAAAQNGTAKDLCPEVRCRDTEGIDASKRAGTFADAATVTLVAGGVFAAAGAVLFFTAPSGARPASGFVAPSFGGGVTGVTFGRAF